MTSVQDSDIRTLRRAVSGFALVFVFVFLARPRTLAPPGLAVALGAAAVSAVSIAGGMLLVLRRPFGRAHAVELGGAFCVLACVVTALAEQWPRWPPGAMARGVSWTCLLILSLPMVLPPPRRGWLPVALLAASAGPFALLVVAARTRLAPELYSQLGLLVSPYLCAGLVALVQRRAQPDPEGPRRVGPYQLESKLAGGGMGEVWRARHEALDRPAAVKLLSLAGHDEDPAVVRRRIEREARATARLASPHVVTVHDFGEAEPGRWFIAMERLEGIDLETLVERHGPVPPARVVHLLLQVCEALEVAHAAELVHRDVKPSNIYVEERGTTHDFVKVIDFGLAVSGDDADTQMTRLTQEGLATGTPAYMAPEMATRGILDHRADIYGVGCVAYFLLTGRLVFESKSPMKMLKDHVAAQPTPPSDRTEVILPEALDRLVLDCLEKHPERRPASASALAERLRGLGLEAEWTAERAAAWWRIQRPPVEYADDVG